MFEKCIDKIELLLIPKEYKKVSKTIFYKNIGGFIKIIKIRKHTNLDNFFIDVGIIIKKYRKRQSKIKENSWTLSCNVKNITKNNLYKGISLDDFLRDNVNLSNDFLMIDDYLDFICNINNLKSLVKNRKIYKCCFPMPLGTKTDNEFEKFILDGL